MREFWVVDPFKHSVMVYGFKDFDIDEYTTCKLEDILTSYFFDGLEIPISEIVEL